MGLWISLFFIPCSSLIWIFMIFFLFFFFFISFLYYFSRGIGAHYVRELFYIDRFSTILIIITFWVRAIIIIRSQDVLLRSQDRKLFLRCNIILVACLRLLFSINHFFFFYRIFEVILVPTIFLIIGWGNQPARLNASYYFSIYTIFSSLPFLGFLISFFWQRGHCRLPFSGDLVKERFQGGRIFLVGAFLVKLPIYGVHLWLPKAHVEAPVGGSMLLAAILLKIGVYGFFRFLFWEIRAIIWIRSTIIRISLLGGVIVSFVCLTQFDIKSLVAYSSVAHIGMLLAGIYSGNGLGWRGRYLIAVAHGFASSGFFALVTFIYEGSSSRRIIFNKGLLLKYPLFCFFLFMNAITNIAAPPSLNLLREIFLYISISSYSKVLFLFLFFIRRIRVGYNLVLYTRIACGKIRNQINQSLNIRGRQFFVLFFHLVGCFLSVIIINHFIYF